MGGPPPTGDLEDTIAAVATAAGPAGVGIVRLSGSRAIPIAAAVLGVDPARLDRCVRVGYAHNAAGERIDQVIAFAMRRPASFTGEDIAELQGHGGAVNLAMLLAAVVDRGARVAEPGELTRRAVANGKLDLARAEALLEVIQAGSERAWRIAQNNLAGRLGSAAAALERQALSALAEIEGQLDFADEDLDAHPLSWVASEVDSVQRGCSALCASFRGGQAARLGITAALVGPVNVGKSSLLNALVGVERALVAPQPGTTRDWLEVTTTWSGIAVTLVDTAGDRATESPIEQRGIELGRERASLADVVILVNDGEAPWDSGARFGARLIVVRSKADREGRTEPGALATSATTGHGLEALRQRILEVAGAADREGSEHAVVTTARQAALAEAARAHSAATLERLRAGAPLELVAAELREVARSLAQLRGVEVGDRVLDEVFSRFCIGK